MGEAITIIVIPGHREAMGPESITTGRGVGKGWGRHLAQNE
jgi:hypothetical protein